MSGPAFFQTPMGRRFYESTLPDLVKEVGRVASGIERLAVAVEAAVRDGNKEAPTTSGAVSNEEKEKR